MKKEKTLLVERDIDCPSCNRNLSIGDTMYEDEKGKILCGYCKERKCELCGLDWVDITLSKEELQDDRDSIEEHGRCIGCYEENGDNYPDRV